MALVTQRPAELDPTIISQCSTLFAMRIANERDQALLRSAVSDAAANLLAFISSLGTREVLAFGEGVALPARIKFSELAAHHIPRSEAVSKGGLNAHNNGEDFIDAAIDRWRGAMMSHKRLTTPDDTAQDVEAPAGTRLDPDRYTLLKKPAELQSAIK